jgi:hypothetical protein
MERTVVANKGVFFKGGEEIDDLDDGQTGRSDSESYKLKLSV